MPRSSRTIERGRSPINTKPLHTKSQITQSYEDATPTAAALYRRARQVFPGGVTHQARLLKPHPIFVSRAQGSRKWDVDGREYVDYFGGHGSLILGHNHPVVQEAVRAQLSRGAHYGASHELELEWAELIQSMIPCAERVRFTVTGTEATHLALRVARAYTRKPKVIRFATHFHGWHDHVAFGKETSGSTPPAGILQAIVDNVLVCPPGDLSSLDELCRNRDDVAAVILEPTGATFGKVPLDPRFLGELRQWTTQRDILLIFDEVISGFRCSLGGAQGYYGVTPDLTTLAKILGGGYPGAALVGRADVMQVMDYQEGDDGLGAPLVVHYGTYNASPITASAGIATLKYLRSEDLIAKASASASKLRTAMNSVAQRIGCDWCVYGDFSAFHIFPNPDHDPVSPRDIMAGRVDSWKLRRAASTALQHTVRVGFLYGGVDLLPWPGGLVSGVHTDEDLQWTVDAFEKLLKTLDREGSLN